MTDVEAARATILAAIAAAEAGPALANYLVRGDSLADGVASRVDFERDVAAEVIVDVLGFAGQVADRELLPYDPSYQVSAGQALVDDLAQVPHLAAVHALVTGPDPELDAGGKPVVALAHRVDGPAGQAIVAYRVKGPGIATRRASGLR